MFASVGAAALGWFLADRAYKKAGDGYREPIDAIAPAVYQTLFNKWYVDEAYDYAFTGRRPMGPVRLGAMGLGTAAWKFDSNFVDGGVNGAGWLTKLSSRISMWFDKWVVDRIGVHSVPVLTYAGSMVMRIVQWGLVQWYAFVMVVGLLGFALYYVWR